MLYLFDEIESFTDHDFSESLMVIPSWRRDKALSYQFATDRKLSVIAYLLLKEALHREYGIENHPQIAFHRNGKPYFPELPHIHFSLSHCRKAVACVISDENIGVDVETYDSYNIDLARHVLSSEELKEVLGCKAEHNLNGDPESESEGGPAMEFARLWTAKESYLKYTGEGLRDNLKDILENAQGVSFSTLHSPKGYACTVCSRSNDVCSQKQ